MEKLAKQEREKVIQDFHSTIVNMMQDMKEVQAPQEYEKRMQSMQKQIDDLTGKKTIGNSPVMEATNLGKRRSVDTGQ